MFIEPRDVYALLYLSIMPYRSILGIQHTLILSTDIFKVLYIFIHTTPNREKLVGFVFLT